MNEDKKPKELREDFENTEEEEACCSTQDNGSRRPKIEDDNGTQISESLKDPMFVIVDSSGLSAPSSRELIVQPPVQDDEAIWKKYISKNIMVKTPIDVPSTSRDQTINFPSRESESSEELQIMDINLQSENEIDLDDDSDDDSLVVSYLKDREILKKIEADDEDNGFSIAKEFWKFFSSSSEESSASTTTIHGFALYEKLIEEDNKFLHVAEMGDHEKLARLINKGAVDLNETDYLSRNALHLTVCTGNIKAVKILLEAGISPNIKDALSRTPLSLCLFRKPKLEMVELLFKHGALLLDRSSLTDTGIFLQFIMMVRPTAEEVKIIKLLLKKGATLEDPYAPAGRQALHFAALCNNCALITVLVELGANLNVRNHRNQTPKDVAIAFKCRDALYCLEDFEFSKMFNNKKRST